MSNKQTPLVGLDGRATSDDKVIGENAWRLLKSFNIDPRELRGIGIQIQKLESAAAASVLEPGQAKLSFKPALTSPKAQAPHITVEPPSQDAGPPPPRDTSLTGPLRQPDLFDLPSLSQVDTEVLSALPEDIRQELEAEYKRRSISPAPVAVPIPGPSRISRTESPSGKRTGREGKITVTEINVKRITQQLAPRNMPTLGSPKKVLFARFPQKLPQKRTIFPKVCRHTSPPNFSIAELRSLKIDPEVFVMLPPDVQREQLIGARYIKREGPRILTGKRKTLKPIKRILNVYRRPMPKARYLPLPSLKQRGKNKGERLAFTETDDLQAVIGKWVEGYKGYVPNERDIDYFAKFLEQCVDGQVVGDNGVERAIAVAKWWLVLLRRYFGTWEECGSTTNVASSREERVGRAWWAAFREVKGRMDAIARRKFGGCLSLR